MELTEMVKIIRELFPEKAVELSESLGLLSDALEDTRQVIKDKMMILFDQGQHEAMVPHNQLAAALLEYIAKVQECFLQVIFPKSCKYFSIVLQLENP